MAVYQVQYKVDVAVYQVDVAVVQYNVDVAVYQGAVDCIYCSCLSGCRRVYML